MKALIMTYFNKAGPQLAQKQKAHGKRSITRIKAQLQTGASSGMTWAEFLIKSLSSSFWWQTELLLMSSEQVGTQEELERERKEVETCKNGW